MKSSVSLYKDMWFPENKLYVEAKLLICYLYLENIDFLVCPGGLGWWSPLTRHLGWVYGSDIVYNDHGGPRIGGVYTVVRTYSNFLQYRCAQQSLSHLLHVTIFLSFFSLICHEWL